MKTIQELYEKRMRLIGEMRKLVDGAKDGVMSAEVKAQYDSIDNEQESLGEQMERLRSLEEAERSMQKPSREVVTTQSSKGDNQERAKNLRRAMLCDYIMRGDVAYGMRNAMELRSLNAGDVQEGGAFATPADFVQEVLTAERNNTFMPDLCTVYTTNASTLGYPSIETEFDDFKWTTELSTGTLDQTMRTGRREFKPYDAAKRVKVSRNLLAGSLVPVDQVLIDAMAYKRAVTKEKGYLTGSGAAQPLGVFTAAAEGVPTSQDEAGSNGTTTLHPDTFFDVAFGLKEGHRGKSTWIMHRLVYKAARLLKDGNGQYIWQPGLNGSPDTLVDRPVKLSEYAPSTMTTGLYVAVLGNFKKYAIVDRVNVESIQILNELYAETNEVGYITRFSGDGMPVAAEAFVRMKMG